MRRYTATTIDRPSMGERVGPHERPEVLDALEAGAEVRWRRKTGGMTQGRFVRWQQPRNGRRFAVVTQLEDTTPEVLVEREAISIPRPGLLADLEDDPPIGGSPTAVEYFDSQPTLLDLMEMDA